MARLLGIDWDHKYLRVVEASVQGGKTVIQHAWLWEEKVSPNPAQAEEAGRRLKERLKEAGIAPAPVRFVVGRDGVICRDVLYPDVPANEVAAIVNFQASKELSIPAEEAIIDFVPSSIPGPLGEKRALATIIHRELLNAIQKTCQVAGLRLEGVSASGIGHIANWQSATGTIGNGDTAGLLVLANGGAELSLVRGGQLLFSRMLNGRGNGGAAALLPELRRTLAAFSSHYPQSPVRSVSITGGSTSAEQEQLAATLGLPVTSYEVLPVPAGRDIPPTQRGLMAGAAGLLQAKWPLATDYLNPKKTLPPPSRKPFYYLIAAAAVIVFLVGLVIYWSELAKRTTRIEELQATKASLQKQIQGMGDIDKRLEALNNWSGGEVILLDEIYELIARFPDNPGVRITKVSWSPITQPTTPAPAASKVPVPIKSPTAPAPKPVARLVIQATGEADRLEKLKASLSSAEHWKLDLWELNRPSPGSVEATLKVFRIPAKDYDGILGQHTHTTIGMTPPARPATERGAQP